MPTTDAALRGGHSLASAMMRVCSDHTREGTLWPVDAALRPEGKAGPLVRTLASHEAYYQRWAKTWEFQALLKARPIAGDAELGDRYMETIAPMVWSAADRPDFVADVQAMRRRVVDHIPLRARLTGRSSWVRAGCATSSSRSSCSSSCTAAPTRRCATRNTLTALVGPHVRRATSDATTAPRSPRPTASSGRSSTGSSSATCGVRTRCRTTSRRCARSVARSGMMSEPVDLADRAVEGART